MQDQDALSCKETSNKNILEAVGQSVSHTARNLCVKTMLSALVSGTTARKFSKYRPKAVILSILFRVKTQRGCMVNWGVYPMLSDKPANTVAM